MKWNWVRISKYLDAGALAFRLTAAALLALWLAHRLGVGLPLWSVLTSLVVTQISLGRSLKATLDYFAATFGGVLWGGSIAILIPHASEAALLLVLMLAVAPLAFAAALYPRLSVGPVTAAIVVLIPEMLHVSAVASGLERLEEVLLGGLTGLLLSFVLLPRSAFQHTREIAARSLDGMGKAIPGLVAGFGHGLDIEEAHRIQDGIGQQLNELTSVAAEAERERPLRLSAGPLTGPLFRTLLRLRHDLVILGRAAGEPMPAQVQALQGPLAALEKELKDHLLACAAALLARHAAPARASVDGAFAGFSGEIAALRQSGSLRELSSEDIERLFAAAFAFEQIHLDLQDLDRCINDWAAS
jgi:uncharacterized membrane protein YccC